MRDIFRDYLKEEQSIKDSATGLSRDAFVECPAVFFHDMSPEEFRSKQQLYQAAYEMARTQQVNRSEECDPGSGI